MQRVLKCVYCQTHQLNVAIMIDLRNCPYYMLSALREQMKQGRKSDALSKIHFPHNYLDTCLNSFAAIT